MPKNKINCQHRLANLIIGVFLKEVGNAAPQEGRYGHTSVTVMVFRAISGGVLTS